MTKHDPIELQKEKAALKADNFGIKTMDQVMDGYYQYLKNLEAHQRKELELYNEWMDGIQKGRYHTLLQGGSVYIPPYPKLTDFNDAYIREEILDNYIDGLSFRTLFKATYPKIPVTVFHTYHRFERVFRSNTNGHLGVLELFGRLNEFFEDFEYDPKPNWNFLFGNGFESIEAGMENLFKDFQIEDCDLLKSDIERGLLRWKKIHAPEVASDVKKIIGD